MTVFTLLLVVHITGGFVSLILGLYLLAAKKGNARHRKLGRLFFVAMLTASLVALPMSGLRANTFLFIVGVFTSFMLVSGKRYLRKKQAADVAKADWLLTVTMLLFALGFITLGLIRFVQHNNFGFVLLVFGCIALLFVYQDWVNFTGRSRFKNFGLTTHIQRMTGSYIASVTAFLVVNNQFLPSIIAWLLPTAALTPLIVIWTRKFRVLKPLKRQA